MEEMIICAPEHQEVFRRVWERVMAGHPETGCPVEVTGDLDCRTLERLVPAELPACPDKRENDLPPPDDRGRADECTARLRRQVLESLEGWQLYRHLARRTRNGPARLLTSLAAERHRQAQKLAAAYFLMTGVRYWPSDALAVPAIPSFWGALRQCHREEERAELSCLAGAEEGDDPALRELYLELAEGCRKRCRKLRDLLARSCS